MRGHWRSAHAATASLAVLGLASGWWTPELAHVALGFAAVPALLWLGGAGGRRLLRLGERPPAAYLNGLFSRMLLLLAAAVVGTGVWCWVELHPVTRVHADRGHAILAEALLATLVGHVCVSGLLRLRRLARG